MMKPHEQRVVAEKVDLDTKIRNLEIFIASYELFSKVPEAEQGRLRIQLTIMRCYSGILGDRIAAFPRG